MAARDSTIVQQLAVKTLEDYIADRCIADRPKSDTVIVVLGRVETPYGVPINRAEVMFSFMPGQVFYTYTTGSDGTFQVCLARSDRDDKLIIQARYKDGKWMEVKRTLAEKVTLVHFVLEPPPPPSRRQ